MCLTHRKATVRIRKRKQLITAEFIHTQQNYMCHEMAFPSGSLASQGNAVYSELDCLIELKEQ